MVIKYNCSGQDSTGLGRSRSGGENSVLPCANIRNLLFSTENIEYFIIDSVADGNSKAKTPDITLSISASVITDGLEISLKASSDRKDLPASEESVFTLRNSTTSKIGRPQLETTVVRRIIGLLASYMNIVDFEFNDALTLTYTLDDDPRDLPRSDNSEEAKANPTGFYAEPSLGYEGFSGNNISEHSLAGDALFNLSTQKWRLSVTPSYEKIIADSDETPFQDAYESEDDIYGITTAVYRNINNSKFGILLYATSWRSESDFRFKEDDLSLPPLAESNKSSYEGVSLGVQWVKVPFLRDEPYNLKVNYLFGPRYHRYADPVEFEYREQDFLLHSLEITGLRHWERTDLQGRVEFFGRTNTSDYSGIALNISNILYITDRLTFATEAYVDYTKERIPNPALYGRSFQFFSTGTQTVLNMSLGFSLRWIIGNRSSNVRDQR